MARDRLLPRLAGRILGLAPPGDAASGDAAASGRARDRHRRIGWTALSFVLARGVTVATAFVSVPLTLDYLGTERYGLWTAIASLIAMLSFADLGIGNSVLSAVSRAHGREDEAALARIVSSSYTGLSLLAALVLAGFLGLYPWLAERNLFNATTPAARAEAGPALAAFVACFALAMPLGVVQRVQMGLQQGFAVGLWQCAGSLAGLAGIVLVVAFRGGLPLLVLAFSGAPLLVGLVNTVLFFRGRFAPLRPRWRAVSRRTIAGLLSSGLVFFGLQVVGTLAFASNPIVIASVLGAAAVADYAVAERLFNVIPLVVSMLTAPLWPAYGEAVARNDLAWVRVTLRRSLVGVVAFAMVSSAALALLAPALIRLWVGTTVAPSAGLIAAFALWKVVEVAGSTFSIFLNGAGFIGFQLLVSIPFGLAALAAKILLARAMGPEGTVWGTLVPYAAIVVPAYTVFAARWFAAPRGGSHPV